MPPEGAYRLREILPAAASDTSPGYGEVSGETGELLWSCDHTLKQTRAWLKMSKKTLRENLRALKERGGYCNCEVLPNVSVSRWPAQENGQPLAA